MTTKKVVVTFTQKEALAARHACSYYVAIRSRPESRRAQARAEKKLLRAWQGSAWQPERPPADVKLPRKAHNFLTRVLAEWDASDGRTVTVLTMDSLRTLLENAK